MIDKAIKQYTIIEKIGEGGMGEVWLAEDTTLGRKVALKFLPSGIDPSDEEQGRFLREAQAASALDHPNICTIYEAGDTDDGRAFIAMAFCDAETVKAKMARGPLELDEALDIAIQIGQGLARAHKEGIVHRDIKPANTILTTNGTVKIVDFGLAKLSGAAQLTMTGSSLGTAAYMSPEQVRGDEVDHRADIWSLGVMLYEMEAGQLPFQGDHETALMYSVLNKDPEPVETYRDDIPMEIISSLKRALEKNRDDRYQSVDEFRIDLQRVLAPDASANTATSSTRTVQEARHNLPVQLTSFIGRDRELAELRDLISDNRLVTLTGTGGSGKTRLSLQIAADLVEDYPDGVWFVELAPVAEPRLVPEVVARVLQVPEEPDVPPLQTLSTYLVDKHLLLLLDNCEHLTEACSGLTHELLQSSPASHILVTSRESLNTPGEITWTVPSLSLPDPGEIPDVEQLDRFEAVQLFVDRAGAIQSTFELTSRNAASVARICQTLDGIPLAIELAAARIKLLSPADIMDRLEDRFRLLTGGMRTGLEQHKTLRATVDWSYELLSGPEQVLFNRLSVFAGGFDLAAVEGVCVGEPIDGTDILDLFSMLVDKSLVVRDTQADGSIRYRLLETLKQYAKEKLSESGEEELTRERHFRHYLELADRAYEEHDVDTSTWVHRLETEHENLRAALDWSSSHPEEVVQLTGALSWFWTSACHYSSGIHYMQIARGLREGKTPAVARLLTSFGFFWLVIPTVFNDAMSSLEEGVDLWRELGNEKEVGLALIQIGYMKVLAGDFVDGARCCNESIEIFEGLEDPKSVARAKSPLCWSYLHQFLPDMAEPIAEEILQVAQQFQMGNELLFARHYHADCPMLREEYPEARIRYGVAMKAALEVGNIVQAATEMQGMAMAYAGESRYQKAIRLDGAVLATYEEYDVTYPYMEFWHGTHKKTVGHAREQVGEEEAAALEAEGRAMGLEKAMEYAFDFDRD
ncbi:protein kinase [Candidatus Zixiibacteriota bacterium]